MFAHDANPSSFHYSCWVLFSGFGEPLLLGIAGAIRACHRTNDTTGDRAPRKPLAPHQAAPFGIGAASLFNAPPASPQYSLLIALGLFLSPAFSGTTIPLMDRWAPKGLHFTEFENSIFAAFGRSFN